MAWDMHQMINGGDNYPACVVVHKRGVREIGKRYVPADALTDDSRLRKAVEGLEGQIAALQAENDALRADNAALKGN